MKKRPALTIAAATSVVIFCLFAVFAGSIAWFTTERTMTNGANSMEVSAEHSHLSRISFHKIVQIDYEENIFYFDQDPTSSATADQIKNNTASLGFEMDHYTLLRKQNPLLALIQLSEVYTISSEITIDVTLSTESSSFLTSYSASDVSGMTNRPLSNIVCFSGGYLTPSSGGDGEGDTLSDVSQTSNMAFAIDPLESSSAQYVFDKPASYQSFWTFDGNGDPVLTSTQTIFSGEIGQKIEYVYVIFDYNESLLEFIYNRFLGQSFLEEDLYFACDWTLRV